MIVYDKLYGKNGIADACFWVKKNAPTCGAGEILYIILYDEIYQSLNHIAFYHTVIHFLFHYRS